MIPKGYRSDRQAVRETIKRAPVRENNYAQPIKQADIRKTEVDNSDRLKRNQDCLNTYGIDPTLVADREALRTSMGITPRAEYGCMTPECREQNRLNSESQSRAMNSTMGKKLGCAEDCSNITSMKEMYENTDTKGYKELSDGARMMIDAQISEYEKRCGSLKVSSGLSTENMIMIGAGLVILYFVMK